MAELFLARARAVAGVERYVVLKKVLANRATDAQFVSMFLDEARVAAQLRHPNIAQLYDVGNMGDAYFFTMEYVHGETLDALLRRSIEIGRPIPLGHVLTIAAGAAAGLHHAHTRTGSDRKPLDIVHRDVSLGNIMIAYEGMVKLVDFGVAKASNRITTTRAGTIKGKVAYLSPEQLQGEPVDRRSDLFSLGVCLHEMLTGRHVFLRDNDLATMAAVLEYSPAPPSAFRGDVTPAVDHLVATALAKIKTARFESAAAMLDAIEAAALSAGMVLSPASLGRYMRELFGDRPEPWLELPPATTKSPFDVVTGGALDAGPPVPTPPKPAAPPPGAAQEPTQLEYTKPAPWAQKTESVPKIVADTTEPMPRIESSTAPMSVPPVPPPDDDDDDDETPAETDTFETDEDDVSLTETIDRRRPPGVDAAIRKRVGFPSEISTVVDAPVDRGEPDTAIDTPAYEDPTAIGGEPIVRPPVTPRPGAAVAPPPMGPDIPMTYPQKDTRIHGSTDTPIGVPAIRAAPIPQTGPGPQWPPTGPIAVPKQISVVRVVIAIVVIVGIGLAIGYAACGMPTTW
jgi:serine/threonine protein kinase